MLETIGPVWDGNEVWLVVAGGATFAAFPAWYATMFSGFYLALLLILVLLIVRVVSFEWREQERASALAGDLAVGEHGGQRRRAVRVGRRAGQPRARRPARLRRPLRGQLLRPLQRLHRRSPGSRPSRSSRCTARPSSRCARRATLCDAGGARPRGGSPSRPRSLGAALLAWTVAVASRPQRQGRVPARAAGRARGRRARARRRLRAARAQRLGVRDDRGGDRRSASRRSSRASTRACWSRTRTSGTA